MIENNRNGSIDELGEQVGTPIPSVLLQSFRCLLVDLVSREPVLEWYTTIDLEVAICNLRVIGTWIPRGQGVRENAAGSVNSNCSPNLSKRHGILHDPSIHIAWY